MSRTPRRLDAYVRVSAVRGREGEKFTSPTNQESSIRQWGKLYGHEITTDGPDGDGAWHELDKSGGTMDREKLNEILARIDAGESDGIVVYRLDRFGRTLIGALQIIERLHAEGKKFASVMDNFDIDTENGRLVLRIMLSLAQYERERIQSTWRTAKANAVERGWHISAVPPFGYRREQLTNNNGEPYLGRLVVHPVEGPLVTEMFERRAGGEPWTQVTRWMIGTGIPARRGGAWTVSTLDGIIENTAYLGIARGGIMGTPQHPDAHDSLTDPATWHAAQRKTKAPKRAAKGTTHTALGAGLVRCAGCRYMTQTAPQTGVKFSADGSGGLNFNYVCSRIGRSNDCPAPALAVASRDDGSPTVDDVIAERVLARLDAQPSGFHEFDDLGADELPELEEDWLLAQARAEECAIDFDLEEEIGTAAWRKRCAALNRVAEEKLERLTQARRQYAAELELGRSGRVLADDWRTGRLSLEEKRKVAANMVQAIFVRKSDGRRFAGQLTAAKREEYLEALRGRVHIVWATNDQTVDVPRPGRRGYKPQPFEF